VDPVPDPLLLRKSGSAGNQTQDLWICSQEDYWTTEAVFVIEIEILLIDQILDHFVSHPVVHVERLVDKTVLRQTIYSSSISV
jgi:hypothetical protein